MNHDNPAARLLAILEAGKQLDANQSCRVAWQQLLQSGEDNSLLMSRLGKVMELPRLAMQAIQDGFPDEVTTCSHWKSQVEAAFIQQNLHSNWGTFVGVIDNHTLNYLKLSSKLLQTISTTKLIADADISSIREQLESVYEEVLSSDLADEIKLYLVRYLRKLLVSIDEYWITGAMPILEAVGNLVGHSVFDKKYYDFLRNEKLGMRVFNLITAMANVVTVTVGLPQITQSMQLLGFGV